MDSRDRTPARSLQACWAFSLGSRLLPATSVRLVLMQPRSGQIFSQFPDPHDVMAKKKNTNSDLMSSKIFVQNYCPVWTPPLIIWLKFVARVPRERSRPSCFLNRPFSLPNLPVCKHLTCDSSFGCPSSEGGNVSELQPLPSHQVSKRNAFIEFGRSLKYTIFSGTEDF